jgi:F0F1-type ATP synthase membrane subunit c/vacuolar-type H+-ATPase subunit K
MSDSILAAIIAATATLSASLLQLRFSVARELAARAQSPNGRKKNRAPFIVLLVMISASGIAGFSLSQWLTENERVAQGTLEHELRARVEEATRTANQLEITRAGVRAEIEMGVMRRMGSDGAVVMATVGPCRPALVVSAPGTSSPPGVSSEAAPPSTAGCTESEPSSITLCATIPNNATVSEIELFSHPADTDIPWSSARMLPGQEAGQARFAEKYIESPEGPGTKQVCQGFSHWSAEHARIARMVVRYGF